MTDFAKIAECIAIVEHDHDSLLGQQAYAELMRFDAQLATARRKAYTDAASTIALADPFLTKREYADLLRALAEQPPAQENKP